MSYVVLWIVNWELCHLWFINYYWLFLCGLCASVAQIKALIGVNPCLTEPYLKKQSQFAQAQNRRKHLYRKEICEIKWFWAAIKQSQSKPISGKLEPVFTPDVIRQGLSPWQATRWASYGLSYSQDDRYLANGSVSGTTWTSVVNL